MANVMRQLYLIVPIAAVVTGLTCLLPTSPPGASAARSADASAVTRLMDRQPTPFVPNVGQWEHAARYVCRSGPLTLFLEDRGWIIDLAGPPATQRVRGSALRMTFEGETGTPAIVGEQEFAGHHNYFVGCDASRWRTGVTLYGSVRYENLYPGIDLRFRQSGGIPEYDLLLQPGAALEDVTVHIEGAQNLSIADDGTLVIATGLGPITQSVPATWQVDLDGERRAVECNFTLLGENRFGFETTGWDRDACLVIDPALIWSSYLGGSGHADVILALATGDDGVVTVAGSSNSVNFPTTLGAYDRSANRGGDAVVSSLDPSRRGAAQLIYSTFLGGTKSDSAVAISVDAGVVTVTGETWSSDFPTTPRAYDTSFNATSFLPIDAFVTRLDPSKGGAAQLVYSTFLGGRNTDYAHAVSFDAGAITVAGQTFSANFPTRAAYDATFNAGDAFVCRLLPLAIGHNGLIYSTFLGGSAIDAANAVSVDGSVVTVAGGTSSVDFPTSAGAFDATFNGRGTQEGDAYVTQLDMKKAGRGQLVYSTYLGGRTNDVAHALSVDARGVVTVAGDTDSSGFPTTAGAYQTKYRGRCHDGFVSRMDPSKLGRAQIAYSTFLGGSANDQVTALAADARGFVTVTGWTLSSNFPTTKGAHSRSHTGGLSDAFVSRLLPAGIGNPGLVYSTFLGGGGNERGFALAVDAVGVVTVAGRTSFVSTNGFPATPGAFSVKHNGPALGALARDGFVSRLSMGIAFHADRFELSLKRAGTQNLTLDAGKQHAGRSYWIFGSFGTSPGITLGGVSIPLNPDAYTDLSIASTNTKTWTNFRGRLDNNGSATASFHVPAGLPASPGITVYHAFVVYGANGRVFMASDPVPLRLK